MKIFPEGINSPRQVTFDDGGNNNHRSIKDIAEKLLFDIEHTDETDVDSIADEYAELKLSIDRADKDEIERQLQEDLERIREMKAEAEKKATLEDLYEQLADADSQEAREQISAEIEALELDYKKEKETIELKHAYEKKIDDLSTSLGESISEEAKAEFSGLIDDLRNANSKDEIEQIFAEIEEFGLRNGISEDSDFEYIVNNSKIDIGYSVEISELYDKLADADSQEAREQISAEIQQLQLNYQMKKKTIELNYQMDMINEQLDDRPSEDISDPEFHDFG